MRLLPAIPAFPVRDVARSVECYRDTLGFEVLHRETGFAILRRDAVGLHRWAATDEGWRAREGAAAPVVSGAESVIAGTASCRVAVPGGDEPPRVLSPLGILHPDAPLRDRWYGTREFGAPRSRPRRGGLF